MSTSESPSPTAAVQAPRPFLYKAFLSYSHAADGRLAAVIQSRLQRFATPWYRRRSIRVFRDTTGLGLTPDLWDAICRALEASEYFVLFASEQAARSPWVGQEVDAFLSAGSPGRMLIVWTDGELHWDDAAGDFDWTRTTCLPARLRGAFRAEPLYLDLRWARTAKDLSPRRPEFVDAVARLSAAVRQLPLDDLVGEDVRQHSRTRRVAGAAVAALTVMLIGAIVGAVVAVQQRNIAREQQRVAEEQREQSRQRLVRLTVSNGVRLIDERDLSGSALWFAEALRLEAGAPGQDFQRLRLRSSLAQHPRLLQMWATGRSSSGRTLARWVTFGRGDRYAITGAVEGDVRLPEGGRPSIDLAPAVEPRVWEARTGTAFPVSAPGGGERLLAVDAGEAEVAIATLAADGRVRVLNGTTGAAIAEMAHPCAVAGAEFSDDGRALWTDCDDHVIRVWDAARATLLASLPHDAAVEFAWMTDDRRHLLSGTTDNTAHVWALDAEGRVTAHVQVPHEDALQEVHVGLDGRRVLTLASYQARLWEIGDDGRPTLLNTWIDVNHIATSPDGRSAVLATGYGQALMCEVDAGAERFRVAHDDVVFDAVFGPDGRRFATASRDRTARMWDANTGAPLAPPLHHEGSVARIDFASRSPWLASITENEIVRVWDLEAGPGHAHEYVKRATFLPDGRRVMTAGDFDAKIWDVATWTPVSLAPRSQVHQASVSPDGRAIATASQDGLVRVWDPATGGEVRQLRHGRRVRQAVFSPDGRTLASAGNAGGGGYAVSVWDLATGTNAFSLPHGNSYLTDVAFSPDGTRLLTIASRELRVWDLARRQEIAGLRVDEVERAAFDSTGTRLALVERGAGVRVLDVSAPPGSGMAVGARRLQPSGTQSPTRAVRRVSTIRPDGFRVTSIAFAAGGTVIAIATEGGQVRMWDTATGQPATPPFGHGRTTIVHDVVVSPDGGLIATCGSDGTARVWDVRTGEPLTPPLRHRGVVHAAFSPDGRRLVSVGGDVVREWDLARDAGPGVDAALFRQAQLLAARSIDTTGAVTALPLDRLLAAWSARAGR